MNRTSSSALIPFLPSRNSVKAGNHNDCRGLPGSKTEKSGQKRRRAARVLVKDCLLNSLCVRPAPFRPTSHKYEAAKKASAAQSTTIAAIKTIVLGCTL